VLGTNKAVQQHAASSVQHGHFNQFGLVLEAGRFDVEHAQARVAQQRALRR
jgi:hypothetical protein